MIERQAEKLIEQSIGGERFNSFQIQGWEESIGESTLIDEVIEAENNTKREAAQQRVSPLYARP